MLPVAVAVAVLHHIARSSHSARNLCIMQLIWLVGMRMGEVAALNVRDVIGLDDEVRAEILFAKSRATLTPPLKSSSALISL